MVNRTAKHVFPATSCIEDHGGCRICLFSWLAISLERLRGFSILTAAAGPIEDITYCIYSELYLGCMECMGSMLRSMWNGHQEEKQNHHPGGHEWWH